MDHFRPRKRFWSENRPIKLFWTWNRLRDGRNQSKYQCRETDSRGTASAEPFDAEGPGCFARYRQRCGLRRSGRNPKTKGLHLGYDSAERVDRPKLWMLFGYLALFCA